MASQNDNGRGSRLIPAIAGAVLMFALAIAIDARVEVGQHKDGHPGRVEGTVSELRKRVDDNERADADRYAKLLQSCFERRTSMGGGK